MALIANELLAFIQHVINTMDEDGIVQLCKSTYTNEEICKAKLMLYETLGKTAQMLPSRRRDGGERSLQDIITLLKQTDPVAVPAFVAKNLHKLPVVTLDHVDVSSLLRKFNTMKAELDEMRGRLDASENTICDLRSELLQIKSNNSLSRSPDHPFAYVNTRRGAQIDSSLAMSAELDGSTTAEASSLAIEPKLKNPSTQQKKYASVAAYPAPPRKSKGEMESPKAEKSPKAKESRKAESLQPAEDKSRRCDEEGFTLVERRKKRKPAVRNHRGTAPYVPELRLRCEVPATQLYVSRLHWSMEVEDVVSYIREKTTYTLRVERLQSRHKVNFSSFVVRVPTTLLSTLEVEAFWPSGVVYRRFRGRLPNEARITSPKKTITT